MATGETPPEYALPVVHDVVLQQHLDYRIAGVAVRWRFSARGEQEIDDLRILPRRDVGHASGLSAVQFMAIQRREHGSGQGVTAVVVLLLQ